jgi:hypothetical protein
MSTGNDITRPRARYISRILVMLLALEGLAASGNSVAGTIQSTTRDPLYHYSDSLFILGTNPVEVSMDGSVPGLAVAIVQNLVAKGMKSAAPITCCSGADSHFIGRAPLVFVASDAAPTQNYRVAWHFSTSDGGTLIVAAELSRNGQKLTAAEGELTVSSDAADVGRQRQLTAFTREVDKHLTPFPRFWINRGAGGGG